MIPMNPEQPAPWRGTYKDLADYLGILEDSARIKAKRKGWRLIRGNDGRTIIEVPQEELKRSEGEQLYLLKNPKQAPVNPEHLAEALSRVIPYLEGLKESQAALEDLKIRTAVAEAQVTELRGALETERQRTKDLEETQEKLQAKLSDAQSQLGDERVKAAEALARVEELRAALEHEKQPWWRRWLGLP